MSAKRQKPSMIKQIMITMNVSRSKCYTLIQVGYSIRNKQDKAFLQSSCFIFQQLRLEQISMLGQLTKRLVRFNSNQPNVKLDQEYKKLWGICRPELKKYLLCGAITLLHAGTFMYLPNIYDDINALMALNIDTTPQDLLIQTYAFKIAKWAGIFGTLGALTYLRRYEFLDVSNKISVRFRTVLYNHILNSDLYRRNSHAQACVHHLVTDVKSVSEFTGQVVFMGVRGICFLAGGIGCLIYYSPYLSLISVGIMSVFNLLFRKRNTLLKHLKQQENKSLIQITQFVGEKFHSLRLIKISNTERFERYQFARELIRFYEYSKGVSKANGINYGFLEGLGLFSLFSVAACGALLISYNFTHFSLIATSTYALYVALGFRSVISFNTELMKMMAIYANIEARVGPVHTHELYNQPFISHCLTDYEQKIKQLEKERYDLVSEGVSIQIQNLYFSYVNEYGIKVRAIYDNFSLNIKPGSIVALVGPSGSGKSTLFNILTKLEEAELGKVIIDGLDVSQLTFKDIQRMVSYVTQEVYLFRGTFRDNLKYGNQHYDTSDERLIECLQMTNALQFVESKGGLDGPVIEKGNNLSGGQKQRLALARALVKHPRLLLLDEGTSGIDSFSEQIIISNLGKHRKDMTTILITHKLQPFRKILTDTINLQH